MVYAALACQGVLLCCWSGVVHSPGDTLPPLSTIAPWCSMVTPVAVNVAVHPASQNCPTDSSACPAKSGNRCAVKASCGRLLKGSVASWLLMIASPFGRRTVHGLDVARLLRQSLLSRR